MFSASSRQEVITSRLRPAARAGLERLLGELEDEDLLNFTLDHVRERKAGPALVEGLEPVRARPILRPVVHFWTLLPAAGEDRRERLTPPALLIAPSRHLQVLEDDASTFARAFYRTVLFEALAADEGVGTEGVAL